MKKKVIIIGVSVVVVVAIVALVLTLGVLSRPTVGKIAVISLSGTITMQDSSLFSGVTITPDLVKDYLTRAEKDKAVKAVVLRIESPGGEIAPCQEILWEIERVKEIKPIVVSMGGMAASGGYYISTKADKIVALPTTMTGSIGVISQIINVQELFEKLGIQMETFKGGKYKDMYSGYREMTSEEKEIMQGMIDEYYELFVDVVVEGRGLSKDEVRELATGQIYTGTEAKELGLVDALGGLDTAMDLAMELADVEVARVEYYKPPRVTLWSLLGFADAIRVRLSGLSAQDIILLEILNHNYSQPLFLYQS
ncbi:MAG: signal peptide peptidase SppA [Dehalococcoidia bacterium]|nr:signal peptide peptidase SppA [Dehalococcoidia bacterium]RLC65429.1 MAG: signal peptide peptidase SppA [Chloroflexota bacterium]